MKVVIGKQPKLQRHPRKTAHCVVSFLYFLVAEIGFILVFGAAPAQAQQVDRLLAAVNGKVVTELDLKITSTLNAVLQLGKSAAAQSSQEELGRLINQELIRQEMDNFPIPESDRDQVEAEVRARLEDLKNSYAEIGGLPALLRNLGLVQDELVAKIRTLVLSEMFISLRFGPFVTVSDEEVEKYFRDTLMPLFRKKGIQDAARLADWAAQITMILKEEKKNQAWYKWLDNVRLHSRIEYFTGDVHPPAKERF